MRPRNGQRTWMGEMKAAEDSRTPRRCRDGLRATRSARFWSAAVLCRFGLRSLAGGIPRKLQALRLVTSAATKFEIGLSHLDLKKINSELSRLGRVTPIPCCINSCPLI